MGSLRAHLRSLAAAWLVFQAAFLLALVPIDCCAAHRPKADAKCHESTSHESMHGQAQDRGDECRLQGTCGGPMASLTALLSNQGVLPTAVPVDPLVEIAFAKIVARENLIQRITPPDTPPPRA
jgi:hypothetical protein